MNELEKVLLRAILVEEAKKDSTDAEKKEVDKAKKILTEAGLNFILLATKSNEGFLTTVTDVDSVDLLLMLDDLFEELKKSDLIVIQALVSSILRDREGDDDEK